VQRFREGLAENGSVLHKISFENRLVAFMLVVPAGERRVHASALNVDREFVGANVGPELLGKLIDMARAGTTIEIEALPRLAQHYEKQYGFVKTGEEVDPADNATVFKLELRPLS
jgi:predicted GNAT family N-acyltransferase